MAYVQSVTNTADPTATTIAATLPNPIVAGNCVVVLVSWYIAGSAEVATCADNIGNTYAQVDQAYENQIQVGAQVFLAKNVVAGTPTVTVTLPASRQFRRITVLEYNAVDADPLDQHAVVQSAAAVTGTDGTVSSSITPTVDNCTIVGLLVDSQGSMTIAAGTGFTERTDLTDQQSEDLAQTTAAAITAKWTVSTTHWVVKFVLALKPYTGDPPTGITGTDRGSGSTNTGSQNTLVVTPGSNFSPRSWAVLFVAYDNSGTNGADPFSAITDSAGNVWTSRQNSLNDPGAASAGIAVRVFTSDMSVKKLTTGDTITVSFGGITTVARAWALHEVKPGASRVISYVTGGQASQTSATPSITTGSITSGDIVLAGVGREGNTAPTGDADSSSGTWSAVLGSRVGTTTSGAEIVTQRKVVTGTATQTYNPTFGGTSADGCNVWIQLTEIPAGLHPTERRTPRRRALQRM